MDEKSKESAGNADSGFDPWVGKIPEEGSGYPLQYSCLENPMDSGAWWAIWGHKEPGPD